MKMLIKIIIAIIVGIIIELPTVIYLKEHPAIVYLIGYIGAIVCVAILKREEHE